MKRLYIIFYLTLLIPIFICCNDRSKSKNEILIDNGKNEKEIKMLEGTNIVINDNYIDMKGAIMEYSKNKNILVFRNAEYNNNKSYYLIYSIDNNKIIKEFGKKGQGPNELIHPSMIVNNEYDNKFGYLVDFGNYKLYDIDNDYNLIYNHKIEWAENLNVLDLFPINDSTFIALTHNSKNGLYINIVSNNNIKQLYDLSILSSVNFFYAYTGTLQINFKLERMMYAYKFFNEIHIFDFNGNNIKKIIGKDKNRNKGNGTEEWLDNPNTSMYYMRSYSTDKYIYLLYAEERTLSEPFKEYTIIDQYDWEGNFINKYKLDKSYGILCVDDETKIFYYLTSDEDDPLYIYKY
jgi:hypothetical protein